MISAHNVIKTFGKLTAVNNVTFTVAPGEIFAFLGPNGAGKTTTIKMLTTLLKPTSGKLELNGFDPVTQQNEARRSFGIVFQDPSLDDELTAHENLELHGTLYGVPQQLLKERMEQMLKFVELWDRKDDLVKHFSGGMKRRLEIARGLTHHPKILFLDEPTLGLDPQTRNHIWAFIQELNKKEGMTVFFTTHYMEEADRVANTIAVIDHGKILIQGSSAKLKEQTKTASLEEAFLALTGKAIREQENTGTDTMRSMRRMWRSK